MARPMLLASLLLISCGGSAESATAPAAVDAAVEVATPSDAATEVDSGAADEAGADATSSPPDGGEDSGEACGCTSFAGPSSVGFIALPLKETSGLASSRRNPGILYGHNDSGDSARVIAMDGKGAQLGQIDFGGATAVDWEDMAVGPCDGGGSCVFVGDFGDNGESRSNYALYAIDEPALDGKPFATKTVAARRYPFAYPDGKHNCETLLVHPTTGDIFVVTKRSSEDGGVYRFPPKLVAGAPVTLERVGAAKGTSGHLVTGGDISPCGDRVLLRTDDPGTASLILDYAIGPGGSVADALASDPMTRTPANETQPEAIAFRHDGRGFYTVSEGSFVQLSFYACK